MFFSKLSAFVAVIALSAAPAALASDHMILSSSMLTYTRQDPIVNPGAVGTHVHAVTGASNFDRNSDYDSLRNAQCTTLPFQQVDKSIYWTPSLYYQDQTTKKLTLMTGGRNHYYFFDRHGPNETVKAFPEGFRMLAGNPARISYNASSFADQAVSFVCLDYSGAIANDPAYAERQDINFPDVNKCADGLRMQIFFPSCWDGVNLDSADHKSHMSYPVDNYNNGACPSSHPVHLVSIFYETFVSVSDHPYWGSGAYVTSTGDPTLLSWHGDFMNGWDVSTLQEAVDTCHGMNGDINACPALHSYIDTTMASACKPDSTTPNEDVGLNDEISALPGCNALRAPGVAPSTVCAEAIPGFIPYETPLPSGWGKVGCIAEGTSGRALSAASTTMSNMTTAGCVAFCTSKGFSIAGVEFGDECYCGNSFSNGATGTSVAVDQCNTACAGNPNEQCGGPQRLTILKQGAAAASSSAVVAASSAVVASSSPVVVSTSVAVSTASKASAILAVPTSVKVATSSVASAPTMTASSTSVKWTLAGCFQDGPARALTGYSTSSTSNTVESCTATCASKGFTLAGLEYGVECYCGNSFSNGLGQAIDINRQCYMTASGNSSEKAGGTWALSVYKSSAAAVVTKRSKHFGRVNHYRNSQF
ncbi:hypothetical protein BC835DRAFT_1276877 [Cytidiella melzeri]|nr:hypothetical protein BC835DRAFT_1276877 [Cytidiella melzeri]